MPYPAKTNRAAILAAAVQQVEREGLEKLSWRSVAAGLKLAPNALYRYFPDWAHLEAAVANEGAARLHAALARAAAEASGAEPALRRMAVTYVAFARDHPALYHILMKPGVGPHEAPSAHDKMWAFVVDLVGRFTGAARAPEAAVAIWGFLHGIVTLEQGGVFGPLKPATAFEFGIEALLAGLPRG